MLLLGQQDIAQQVAADEIAVAFAAGNPVTQHRHGGVLELQIALQDLLYVLADHQLAELLEIGQALEEENPFDQAVGVLHFLQGFPVVVLSQAGDPPVLEDS